MERCGIGSVPLVMQFRSGVTASNNATPPGVVGKLVSVENVQGVERLSHLPNAGAPPNSVEQAPDEIDNIEEADPSEGAGSGYRQFNALLDKMHEETGFVASEAVEEFERLQAGWSPENSPYEASVSEIVDQDAQENNGQVLARGLAQFPQAEQEKIYSALIRAERALVEAQIMLEYPAESDSIMRDYFGLGFKRRTKEVLSIWKKTQHLLHEFIHSSWGPGRFAKLSQPADAKCAVALLDVGAIVLYESGLARPVEKLAAGLIHEVSHFKGVRGFDGVGPETDDYWYMSDTDPEMTRRQLSAEFVRYGSTIPVSRTASALFVDGIRKITGRNISYSQAGRLFKRSPWLRSKLATLNADNIAGAAMSLSIRYQQSPGLRSLTSSPEVAIASGLEAERLLDQILSAPSATQHQSGLKRGAPSSDFLAQPNIKGKRHF